MTASTSARTPATTSRLWWVLLLVVAMLAAACGGGDDGDDAAGGEAEAAAGEPVTLTFWNGFTGPDGAVLEELVTEFNGSQDDVVVEMQIQPWDVMYQKLLPAFSAGEGPDLVALHNEQLPQYVSEGVFAPVGDIYERGNLSRDVLIQSAADAGTVDGEDYAVPMNFTTLLLYWNKTMFEEAGLDPEQPPTTWDEWADYAQQLTIDSNGDGTPEQYGYAIADNNTIPMWPILLWGNGGGVVSEDGSQPLLGDPATVEAVQYWSDLVVNDKISPIGLGGADADKLFQTEKAAMEVVGPWMTAGFEEAGIDFGLAMVPAGPVEEVTLGSSVLAALNAEADDATRDAAYDFLEFWNSKESQITWSVGSGFPPNRTDIEASELSENPYVAEFAAHADKARFFLTGVEDYQQVVGDVFEPALQQILNGEAAPEEILPQAGEQLQGVLGAE